MAETRPVLAELNPQQAEAVRLYTDPLLPTYGNKQRSAAEAGYNARYADDLFSLPYVSNAVERILESRFNAGKRIVDYLAANAGAAAQELVRQVSVGADLEFVDPIQALGLERDEDGKVILAPLTKEEVMQVKEINAHNRNVIGVMSNRREAAMKLIAYTSGTPEQRVRTIHEKRLPDEFDLSNLSQDELSELVRTIHAMRREVQILEIEED